MAIAFACQFCARPHRVDEKYAGKRILCKKCGEAIRVPAEMSAGSMAGRNLEARKAGGASQAGAGGASVATTVQTSCPYCERPHKVDVRYAGRKIKCKKCGEGFRVPLEDGAGLPGTVAREELLRGGVGQAEEEREGREEAERVVRAEGERARAESERLGREEQARIEAERLAREEAERLARIEAERKAREEADRKAREDAERVERAEAERLAKMEAERKAREEAERVEAQRLAREAAARAEAERLAKIEAERKAREEAERVEAERLARAEAERAKRAEAERAAKVEAERLARIEVERKAREEAARIESERRAREAAAKAEAERLARIEVERKAREEAARIESERLAREAAAKAEAERLARIEAERKAHEEAARVEAERLASEEAERIRRIEMDRAAKAEAERLAKMEAQRKAREEAAREAEAERLAKIAVQRKAREEAARIESERLAREEAERLARVEAERVAREEAERQAFLEAERAVAERKRRAEAERAAKIEAERVAREEAEKAERVRRAEAERAAKAEAERLAKMEAERLAREEAERAEAERLARAESEKAAREEAERQAAEQAEQAEKARLEAQRREQAAAAEALAAERGEAERLAKIEAERGEAARLAEIEAERAASEESRAAEDAAEAAEVERVSGIERLAREQAERREREEAERREREEAPEEEDDGGRQAEEKSEGLAPGLAAVASTSATPAVEKAGDRPAGKGFWGKLMGVWKKPDGGLAAEAGRPVGSTGRTLADGPGQSAVPAAAEIARPASAPAAASATGAPVKDIAPPSKPGVMTVPVIAPIVRTVAPKAVTLQAPVMAEVFHWDAPLPGKEAPAVASVAPGVSSAVNVPVAAVARAEGNGAPIDPSSIGTGLDASAGSADEDADDDAGDAPMAILVEDAEAGVVPANASATEVFELEVPETVDVGGTATEATPTEFVPAELLDEPETSVDSGEDWVEGADVEESPAVTLEPRERLTEVAEPEVARAEMPSEIFPQPEAEEEKSAGGSPILRHRPRDSTIQIAPPLTPYLSHITGHIERTIGRAPIIFHELVSVGVHIDLHVIPPTDDPPSAAHPRGTAYFTIVTSGLSTRPMNVPAGCDYPVHAELMICLPVDWPGMNLDGTFDTEKMRDEKNWWPLRWLKAMARMPHEYNTFIGPGHTIPNGANAEPFAVNTALGCMLVQPPLLNPRASRLVVSENVAVQFYALWPIYREELELKQSKGIEALIERFRMSGTSELIQLDRKNVCRR